MSEHWAVIPVRGLTDSKARLSGFLGERKKLLVEALLQDVLSSILRSRVYDKVLVVSPDDSVSALARRDGLSFLGQTGLGLNSAIEQANNLADAESSKTEFYRRVNYSILGSNAFMSRTRSPPSLASDTVC